MYCQYCHFKFFVIESFVRDAVRKNELLSFLQGNSTNRDQMDSDGMFKIWLYTDRQLLSQWDLSQKFLLEPLGGLKILETFTAAISRNVLETNCLLFWNKCAQYGYFNGYDAYEWLFSKLHSVVTIWSVLWYFRWYMYSRFLNNIRTKNINRQHNNM
jgi:hypothetical protein